MKIQLYYSAVSALLIGCWGAPAYAENSDDAVSSAENQPDISDAIIVTARRRAERLDDVPISIQAFDSESLRNQSIERVADLERVVPTLRLAPTSSRRNNVSVELRGIGGVETAATQDIATAFYLNEVIQARPVGLNQALFDVDSVQVLLGPQGTLFGRNATAGAILVTTRRPTDELGGEIGVTIGNYDRFDVSGIFNLPVTEGFALRFAGQSLSRDGYTRNIVTGDDLDDEQVASIRISSLINPSDSFENLTVFDYYDSESNGTGASLSAIRPCPAPPGTPGVSFPVATCIPAFAGPLADELAAQNARGPREVAYNWPSGETSTAWGVANTSTLRLSDNLVLKNIFGYREIELESFQDHDATPLNILHVGPITENGHQISNELQLQGESSRFNWIIGAYYFRERDRQLSTSFSFGSTNSSLNDGTATNTSASIFAQGDWEFADRLTLTAGGRLTRDIREVTLESSRGNGACRLVDEFNAPLDPCARDLRATFVEPTWTLSLDYKPSEDALLYIAHRRGYRSGGFNFRATSLSQSASYDPELVTDVEIGARGTWRVGDVRINGGISAYQNWYTDIQRTVALFQGPVLVASVFNAAEADIHGFEANLDVSIGSALDLSTYVGFVDAQHTKYNTSVDGVPVTLTDVPFGISKYNFGAALTWTPMDNADGQLSVTASLSARSPFFAQQNLPDLEPEARVGWQSLTNLTINWREIAGTPLSAEVFVRNLFDEEYVQSLLSLSGQLGFTNRVYAEPRMFGIALSYAFGGER